MGSDIFTHVCDAHPFDGRHFDSRHFDTEPFDTEPFDTEPFDTGPFDGSAFDRGTFDRGPTRKTNLEREDDHHLRRVARQANPQVTHVADGRANYPDPRGRPGPIEGQPPDGP